MILSIFLLSLIILLQSTLIPLDLVLMVLITRGFVTNDSKNYWLAFGSGLILALLLGLPLGSLSLIYLGVVLLISLIKTAPFFHHLLIIIPASLGLLLISQLLVNLIVHSSLNWWPLIVDTILIFPIYLIIRIWEERFVPRPEIKLKIGK